MIKYITSNKGQTLIEVIAAIAVGTLIITALLSLATRSNRNANFARTSAQATKLSQQGLEIIRNIDSVKALGSIRNFGSCGATCIWSDLYSDSGTPVDIPAPASGPYNFVLVRVNNGACLGTTESWCLDYNGGTPPPEETFSSDIGNFTREVLIEDDAQIIGTTEDNPCNIGFVALGRDRSKLVTVTVRWDDPSGAHEAEVSTCISNL